MPKLSRPTPQKDESLSQLIRLKKCEKPDAAFWAKFDEELRSKQLSAIVVRQPWYLQLARRLLEFARKATLPSATAAALGLVCYQSANLILVQNAQEDRVAAPVVAVEKSSPISSEPIHFEVAATLEDQFSFDGPAIYGVNVLAKNAPSERYTLEASPKTFTSGQHASQGTQLGAKIIRSSRDF